MDIRLSRARQVHLGVTVLSGLCALVLGLVVGHLSGGSATTDSGGDGVGPTHEVAGVGVGFARSPVGAAAAIAAYQDAFATPAILRPETMRRRVGIVATPGYAATMLAANSPGGRRIGAGPIGTGAREGVQTLYASVPVGYRIESYSPQRARVLTWGLTLLGNAARVEPEAYFGLAHTSLQWREGDWKIASVHSGFGPTPRIETGGHEVGGFDLMALARGLKSYDAAP